MWSCDPRRFTAFAAEPDYAVAKGMEVYGHEYAINFPRHAWPAGRNRKLSPIHDRIAALGAQFNAYNGWERATWYAKPGDDTSEEATQTFRRDGPWEKRIREECLAVRDAAGILDLPGFSRFRLQGEGAREWLVDADHRHGAEARPHRARLFRRRQGPHRHRNVDHGAGRGFLLPDHRGGCASGTTSSGCRSICRKTPAYHAAKCDRAPSPARSCRGRNRGKSWPKSTDADLSLPWLSHQSVADRRPLVPAGARLLRRRARLGNPHQGRATRRRSSTRSGPPARSTG